MSWTILDIGDVRDLIQLSWKELDYNVHTEQSLSRDADERR